VDRIDRDLNLKSLEPQKKELYIFRPAYCILKTWCTISFLFSTKCRVFQNFILFCFIQYSRFT